MFHLRNTIEAIFNNVHPEYVLNKIAGGQSLFEVGPGGIIDRDIFHKNTWFGGFHNLTEDEIEHIATLLKSEWTIDRINTGSVNEHHDLFWLLIHFSRDVLLEENHEPMVVFLQMLRWRMLSHSLGEDLFTTSFFAYKDNISRKDRTDFTWRPVIRSDNARLHNMLSKGIAENHCHLKGTSPHFTLSWLSIMNRIESRYDEFRILQNEMSLFFYPRSQDNTSNHLCLYQLVKIAAFIRVYMFYLVLKEKGILKEADRLTYLYEKLSYVLRNPQLVNVFTSFISQEIAQCGALFGRWHKGVLVDYAIPTYMNYPENSNANLYLYGERYIMYNIFKTIYASGDQDKEDLSIILYLYILIKGMLRNELIQVNTRPGFANFARYEDRKEMFLEGVLNRPYKSALYHMAIEASYQDQNLISFEARIAPKNIGDKNQEYVNEIDTHSIDTSFYEETNPVELLFRTPKREFRHFYVFHFIKEKESLLSEKQSFQYLVRERNFILRRKVKAQALAIRDFREKPCEEATRVLGIDAANTELGARPEVFAQAFRMLRGHDLVNKHKYLSKVYYLGKKSNVDKEVTKHPKRGEVPQLNVTYHVGEDFYDIPDGLRAIDEALMYFEMQRNDRIGHALALGIDPEYYYKKHEYELSMPGHILLDNIVWLLVQINESGLTKYHKLVSELENMYLILVSSIYMSNSRECLLTSIPNYRTYYLAWHLRGDNPDLYRSFSNSNFDEFILHCRKHAITYLERCSLVQSELHRKIRMDKDSVALYHSYHFDPCVRIQGEKIVTFNVPKEYSNAVLDIQKEMQKKIARMGIGIETNPSSNYLIGRFGCYCQHPITKFFNIGLTTDEKKILDCQQLFVSINSDDQGVFNTYLENEYALMAIALCKQTDEEGHNVYNDQQIYDWLERIRQMGLEQSFLHKN